MNNFVIEFEKVTKYPLLKFFERTVDFLDNSYPEIERYFSGEIDMIQNNHLIALSELNIEYELVSTIFNSFSNKFSNVGYWDLLIYIEELQIIIEKIKKLPKFRRTSLNLGSYAKRIQSTSSVGGLKTFEDAAAELNYNSNDAWVELMIRNGMNEGDWDIDNLKNIKGFVNVNQISVESILDQPIGEKVYGVDIQAVIEFEYNDLKLIYYQNNVEQKCNILGSLSKGDVPENPQFGKDFSSESVGQFMYPKVSNDIIDLFMQNDLFEEVKVKKFDFSEGGQAMLYFDIKTKYDYKTERNITV